MNDSPRNTVRILDEDRSLGSALSQADLSAARRYAVADVHELGPGSYRPAELFTGSGLLGLLVLDGLLVRQVGVGDRRCGELVGPGAVLRPWDDFTRNLPLPFEIDWRVIQPVRLALLDRRVLLAMARWPALIDAFLERANERAHTLAFNIAIQCLQRIDLRLLMLFWHLADQYGKVTPAGTVLPLTLSHSDLAELIGAARPSVSTALKELEVRGLVHRNSDDRSWLLGREPPDQLETLRCRRDGRPSQRARG